MGAGESAGRLRGELTEFVGRRAELALVRQVLGTARLVTLTGPGGIGKTRLALQAAAGARRAFGDGVWLAELGGLQDSALLVPKVARLLGLSDQSARWAVATVPPMSVPAEVGPRRPEDLLRYEAVRLFTERAAAVLPGFTLDADNGPAVAGVCRRLDGILCAILGVLILAIAKPGPREIAKGARSQGRVSCPHCAELIMPEPASAATANKTSTPPYRQARSDHGSAKETAMTKRQVIPGVNVEPRISETAMGKVEFDLTDGDGPVVLSVHGGIGGADQGRLIADWLAGEAYRILSPSRPGYLGTPRASGAAVDDQADLLAALLDTLEIEQVALLSYSAGGPVAYSLAARHPGRVLALMAISSLSGPNLMPNEAGRVREAVFLSTPGQKLLGLTMDRLPRVFLNATLAQTGYLPKSERKRYVDHVLNSPDALAFIKGLMAMMDPYSERAAGVRNDFQQGRVMPPLPLADITCPTLVIHGTHDADAEFYHGVRAHEQIKGAERYWIEGGDHLAFWLSPESPKAQAVARVFVKKHITP